MEYRVDGVNPGDRVRIVALAPAYVHCPEQGLVVGALGTVTRVWERAGVLEVWVRPDSVQSWTPLASGWPFPEGQLEVIECH